MGGKGSGPVASLEIAARNQEMIVLFQGGLLETDLAKGYGITRERVRQILNRELGRAEKRATMNRNWNAIVSTRRIRAREAWLEYRRLPKPIPCRVCGTLIHYRRMGIPASGVRKSKTGIFIDTVPRCCSSPCTKLWQRNRYRYLTPEEKRRHNLWVKTTPGFKRYLEKFKARLREATKRRRKLRHPKPCVVCGTRIYYRRGAFDKPVRTCSPRCRQIRKSAPAKYMNLW